jgi:hypothetical protein
MPVVNLRLWRLLEATQLPCSCMHPHAQPVQRTWQFRPSLQMDLGCSVHADNAVFVAHSLSSAPMCTLRWPVLTCPLAVLLLFPALPAVFCPMQGAPMVGVPCCALELQQEIERLEAEASRCAADTRAVTVL